MAEITLSLLTPISIRLSWAGSGDFEVWSKSDHPAGQEFAPLATVTGNTYDVGSLSWTTTYYFKVRQVGGAFGSEVHVFVCCGQAVLLPGYGNPPGEEVPPPTLLSSEYWQQAAAPGDNLDVAFVGKNIPHSEIYIWNYDGPSDTWSFGGTAEYTGNFFPVGVRQQEKKVAIADTQFGSSGWYRALIFTFYNSVYKNVLWAYPESAYSALYNFNPPTIIYHIFSDGASNGYWFVDFDPASTAKAIEFDDDLRIVLGLYMEAWPPFIDDVGWDWHIFQIKVSKDFGQSWTDENIYISQTEFNWENNGQKSSIAEDGSGNIWCTAEDANVPWAKRINHGTGYLNGGELIEEWWGWDDEVDPIMYVVLKWVEGSGAVVVREIYSVLVQVYLPPPYYTLVEPGYNAKGANVAAEESKIAVAYLYSYLKDNPVTYRYYGDAVWKLDISTDGGSTWGTKTITGAWKINPEWTHMLPPICISNGNIIVYLIGGTQSAPTRHIMRSTDDGDTWSEVYDFTGIVAFDYPWVCSIQSRGDHITLAGCKFGVTTDGPLAYFESLDAGATWAPVEIIPTPEEQILVPA
jgi:hypothetical protein